MKGLSSISASFTLSEAKSFWRNDPHYYVPMNTYTEDLLKAGEQAGVYKIKELCKVAKIIDVTENPENKSEFSYIDIGTNKGNLLAIAYKLKGEEAPSRARRKVRKGDLLTAVSGSQTGKEEHVAVLVPEELDGGIASTGFEVIRPLKIDPYYLLALFNHPIIKKQIFRRLRGSAIPAVWRRDLRNILIPVSRRLIEIGNKLKQAIEAKIEAEKKRKEIEEIFERNLGNIEVRKLGGYVFKLSYCIEAGRLDPHFYYPEFLKVLDLLNNSGFEIKRMSELVKFSKETTNPFNTTQFVYVEIADVDLRYGFISSHSIVKGSNAPSRARKIIREGALLIPLTRPYRGAIAVVDSRYNEAITTTGFSVSYPKSDSLVDSYYLCAFLKSPYGLIQLIQRMSNANYPAILEDDIADILVPILPNDIKTVSDNMKEIVDNLLLSKQLHFQAMEELNKLLGLNAGGDNS
ncbi:restriction endonuclease subunit S [bacterium]|nr:restriction endonuclease subunit S [bacterium]